MAHRLLVMPAKAGIQSPILRGLPWTPACAGVTKTTRCAEPHSEVRVAILTRGKETDNGFQFPEEDVNLNSTLM
jgi:hypothetical protein